MAKILVVEDDEVARMVLAKIMEDENEFQPIMTGDGEQAIAALKANDDIKAILLDRNMPKMGGMETLEALKANVRWSRIPVIFQTAADTDADVIEGMKAGAYYYLKKPYEPEMVRNVLRAAIESFGGHM